MVAFAIIAVVIGVMLLSINRRGLPGLTGFLEILLAASLALLALTAFAPLPSAFIQFTSAGICAAAVSGFGGAIGVFALIGHRRGSKDRLLACGLGGGALIVAAAAFFIGGAWALVGAVSSMAALALTFFRRPRT